MPPKGAHPEGESKIAVSKGETGALNAETFAGKIHIEWDPQAQVTPMGHCLATIKARVFATIIDRKTANA